MALEIILGGIALFAIGVVALHNSVSNSTSSNLILDEMNEFTEAEKKLKAKLFLGIVTIVAKIFLSSNESTNTEMIESIAQDSATGADGVGVTGISIGMNITQDAIQTIVDGASNITAIPNDGSPIPSPLIPPDVGSSNPPPLIPPAIPDEGPIPNPLNPPDVGPTSPPSLVPPDDGPFGIPPLVPPVEKPKGLGGNIQFSKKKPSGQTTNGETNSTQIGKQVHNKRAEERRKSGEYDTVNEALRDSDGNIIEVPKRINKDGKPSKKTQRVIPDAVQGPPKGNIIDDKPLGRPISKDKQEIRRFIDAYTKKYGEPPKKIIIERYNPKTGEPAGEEVYDINMFKIP